MRSPACLENASLHAYATCARGQHRFRSRTAFLDLDLSRVEFDDESICFTMKILPSTISCFELVAASMKHGISCRHQKADSSVNISEVSALSWSFPGVICADLVQMLIERLPKCGRKWQMICFREISHEVLKKKLFHLRLKTICRSVFVPTDLSSTLTSDWHIQELDHQESICTVD